MDFQTPLEEKWNTISHAVGAFMGVFGLVALLMYNTNRPWSIFSIVIYGISIIVLFSASALYHAAKTEEKKRKFRIVDHISIYLLIAGTYTPVVLLLLAESKGWLLFYLVWGIALVGAILKLFFTGRFGFLSTLLYLVMGWLIVLDFQALKLAMNPEGIQLLWGGGAFYTIGIIFYAIKKIPFHHVIWHFFVLGGAICHYFMILNYVIR
ncbi:PAQR family membrane homeostasis protein TrhA [Tenacibaculum xiamenense]|uniref:PAQR family membrane homeostasis protein TrhA n=1 Tax=Tenacibaculum xiamenense TaxID=1261553 RepID=UPI003893D5B4